jgi:hypothetical protein
MYKLRKRPQENVSLEARWEKKSILQKRGLEEQTYETHQ